MKLIFEFGDGEVRKMELDEAYGTGEYFKLRDVCGMYPNIGKELKDEDK